MSHPHAPGRDAGSGHEHAHDHEHPHVHEHSRAGLVAWLRHTLRPHSHEAADQVDAVMEASAEGMRVLWISLGVLGLTALIQAVVSTVLSGSVGLLGDTLHNAADALTAVPLGVAFTVGRTRPPTRRYTYGYGRAEDLAGVAIVLTIAASSALAAYEAVTRLMHPRHVSDLIAVAAAALVGFAGNRAGGAIPDPRQPEDRLSGLDRGRAACPYGRIYLAGGTAGSGRGRTGLGLGRPGGRAAHHRRDSGRLAAGGPRDLPAADGRGGPRAGRPG